MVPEVSAHNRHAPVTHACAFRNQTRSGGASWVPGLTRPERRVLYQSVPRVAGGTSVPDPPLGSASRTGARAAIDRRRSYTRRVDELALGRVRAAGLGRPAARVEDRGLLGRHRASPASSASSARSSPPTTSAPPARSTRFTVAFQVPNLIRSLVADAALSSAFVPVFSELLEKGERKRALARRLDPLLAPAARSSARLTALLHRHRAALIIAPFGDPGWRPAARDHACADPVPDRRPARGLRDHRRDPQQLRRSSRCRRSTPVVLEPRDHRRPRARRPARRDSSTRSSTSTPVSIVVGTVIQVLLPAAVAARAATTACGSSIDWRDPAVRRVSSS